MRSWKHFLFRRQTKLFMKWYLSAIGSKRKRVISKKASFLVGSIILQTWNIHVSDLMCQQEGVTSESYNTKHFIYNQWGKRRLFVGHQFLPTLLEIRVSMTPLSNEPSGFTFIPITFLWFPFPMLHSKTGELPTDCCDFKSHHKSLNIRLPYKGWLLAYVNTGWVLQKQTQKNHLLSWAQLLCVPSPKLTTQSKQ